MLKPALEFIHVHHTFSPMPLGLFPATGTPGCFCFGLVHAVGLPRYFWGGFCFGRGLCVLCFCFFCLHYIPYDACANTTGVRLVYFFCYLFACAFNFLRSVFIHKSLYVPTGRAATNGTICSAFGLELADCVFHGAYCFVRY